MQYSSLLLGAAALLTPVFAQTFTDCNPMNQTCPNDPGFGINHNFVFNTSDALTTSFNTTAGTVNFGTDAEFTVAKKGDSPTVKSNFYIFFGSVSVIMKAATGQGIVSSIVLESDDLDEIDWEFIGGNGTHVQTNYFGKGNTTSYDRAKWHPVSTDVRENYHNYTVNWTNEKMDFYIDGGLVRTLMYGDANGGKNYPQTPATVRLGIWAGGDPGNNKYTVEWAGGTTDYSKGPYTMHVSSTNIQDYGTGKEYVWADRTGSWQSIKSLAGNSTAAETILKAETPTPSVAQKFQALPQGTKLAVYCGGGAAAALLLSALLFTCIRQRRKGRQEREAYNAKVEKEREEAYRDQMELREKGLGGWDKGAYAKQGDDALGGWGGTHVVPAARSAASPPPIPKLPVGVAVSAVPSRVNSPLARQTSPQTWNGGNQGGMAQNAQGAYSGGYGGANNIPRSPNFPLSPPPAQQGYSGPFNNNGGYQRF